MSVTPSLTQFAQDHANSPLIIFLQVMVILVGVVLLIQVELLNVSQPREKRAVSVLYTGILPLLIAFVVIIVARFLQIIF